MNVFKCGVFSLCLLAISAVSRGEAVAAAGSSTGYVCRVSWTPENAGSQDMGSAGYVFFNLNSQPFCQGTLLSSNYACSVNATNVNFCALSFLRSETQLSTLAQMLRSAAADGQKIFAARANDNGVTSVEFATP